MSAPETRRSAYDDARRRLGAAGIATADLDARLLVQKACDIDHAVLIAEGARHMQAHESAVIEGMLVRRLAHEPVSRILGAREFYGRRFVVTPDVLDPRPDTETLIDLVLELLPADKPARIADLGCGSGVIITSLLAERVLACGTAIDVSDAALAVTMENAGHLQVTDRLVCIRSNFLETAERQFDVIVSNPPYIPSDAIRGLAPEVRDHDPHLALDGGSDGLACYRSIAAGAGAALATGGFVGVEIGAGQGPDVTAIFASTEFNLIAQKQDLAGHIRALAFARA